MSKRPANIAFEGPKYKEYRITDDAATYQAGSYDRYIAYINKLKVDHAMSCDINEATKIYSAFEDGFNENFNGGKEKMIK